MSKMGAEYLRYMENQFGDVLPAPNVPCAICGQPYEEHNGLECPELISLYELLSCAYDKYFTPNEVESDIEL